MDPRKSSRFKRTMVDPETMTLVELQSDRMRPHSRIVRKFRIPLVYLIVQS
jgi:hypothetical protein